MPRPKAIPCSGSRPQRPILLLTGSIARPRSTPKARSSPVEHCQYMAEVGGSIPSRAYQFRGNRLKWLTGRAARGLGAAWRLSARLRPKAEGPPGETALRPCFNHLAATGTGHTTNAGVILQL